MSLALAQILWKGDGAVSIDRLRAHHSHHGLDMPAPQNIGSSLAETTSSLRAKPFIARDGNRIGTFEVWHRYSRHLPVIGEHTFIFQGGGRQSGPDVIFATVDERPSLVPNYGLSFLDCIASVPAMGAYLPSLGVRSRLVRATVSDMIDKRSNLMIKRITVHPGYQDLIEQLSQNMKFDPNGVDKIIYTEFGLGFGLEWRYYVGVDQIDVDIPDAFSVDRNYAFFVEKNMPLNEFGCFYVALYILGMLSRYYPDLWHRQIEKSTDLSIAAECLLDVACQRMPLLALGELESAYFLVP